MKTIKLSDVVLIGQSDVDTITSSTASAIAKLSKQIDTKPSFKVGFTISTNGKGYIVINAISPKFIQSGVFTINSDGKVVDENGVDLVVNNFTSVPSNVQDFSINSKGELIADGVVVGLVPIVALDDSGAPTYGTAGVAPFEDYSISFEVETGVVIVGNINANLITSILSELQAIANIVS